MTDTLIRWRDPALGEISPGQFIPVAEDTGFIIAIGDWVLGQAVRQAALWLAAGLVMPVSVNVSALQFQQDDFIDRVDAVLRAHALPGALLELELTESILCRTPTRPCCGCPGWTAWACAWRSTISAPATPAWPT